MEGFQPDPSEAERPEPSPVERLREAEPYFEHLVDEMAEGIKGGRWTDVLGDDVSGRVPALILHDIIGRYQTGHNKVPAQLSFAAIGFPSKESEAAINNSGLPATAKYDMHRDATERKDANLKARLQSLYGSGYTGRVLFVTEMMSTDQTVLRTSEILYELGVSHDVVSVADEKERGQRVVSGGDTLSYGGLDAPGVAAGTFTRLPHEHLYAEDPAFRAAVGVEKSGTDIVSYASRLDQLGVNNLRAEIAAMSDRLYQRL